MVEFACINFLDTFVKRKKQEIQKNQEKAEAEKDVKKVETVVNSIEANNVHEILKEKPVDNHDVAAIIKWNAIKGGKMSEYFHFILFLKIIDEQIVYTYLYLNTFLVCFLGRFQYL